MGTIHIEAEKEKISNLVLMPGDPNRVKYISDNFLENAEIVNERRGELGVTGYYKNKRITVFSSGMGIPSMGIYSYELFNDYDVDVIIRIGTAKGEKENASLGDLVLVTNAFSESNYDVETTGKEIESISSSEKINEVVRNTATELKNNLTEGSSHTVEAFYERQEENKNYTVTEMECYSLFINASILKKNATAIVTVTDTDTESLDPTLREKNLNEMITLALESIIKF